MATIEFQGDWSQEEIEAIASTLRKSLSIGDEGIPDSLNPPAIALPGTLSKEQLALLKLMRQAGQAAAAEEEPCTEPLDWDDYQLSKTVVGAQKTDPKTGNRYIFTQKHRWQRVGGGGAGGVSVGPGNLRFPMTDGEFGEGVYMAIAKPQGNLKVRLRVDAKPEEIILQDRFEEIENDLAIDLATALDAAAVKGVVKVDGGAPQLIMLRSPRLITPLGILSGSGDGVGAGDFNVVNIQEHPSHIILDIEFVDQGAFLAKAARKTFASESLLDGSRLVSKSPALDRRLVRSAIKQWQNETVHALARVSLLSGVPDFLSSETVAFCLPSDRTIHLCPHDPQQAIATFTRRLASRLQKAIGAGAIGTDEAFRMLMIASELTAQDWLVMLLKRYSGAIAILNQGEVDDPVWSSYLRLLGGRGVQYWGDRQSITECMAEDFRCIYDPDGLPNLVTLEWDLVTPAIGRMCQQLIANQLSSKPDA